MNSDTKILLAGGISRGISVSIVYPLDTIKSRLQYSKTTGSVYTSLYRGYLYTVITQANYGMLVFGTYEMMKKYGNYGNILNACFSDIVGSIFLCPCEVMKQNIQIGRYKSIYHAMNNMNIGMLYKGYTGLLARDLPFRTIQLPLYDYLKDRQNNACVNGAVAGMTAAAITNPVDVIKTQMMCNVSNASNVSNVSNASNVSNVKNMKYNTICSTITSIYNTPGGRGGLKAFAYGLPQRVIYLGSVSSIFFIVFEKIKAVLSV